MIPLFEEWKTLLEDISKHIRSNDTMSLYEKLKVESIYILCYVIY